MFNLPAAYRKRLRTSNILERLNEEVRRRIKVIGSFPNSASALRLMSFVLMERGDDWGSTKRYVTMTDVKCGGGMGNAAKGWNCARARGTERKESTATRASMTHKMRMRCVGNNGMTSADWTGVAGAAGAGRGR
ncbi:MAG: transposase [Silvanigrellales bacterium]|nr:transposase [Silvanigrellales bacterium]